MLKTCCKCKLELDICMFGKLKSSKDGLRYDCKNCRKNYRELNKEIINNNSKDYYKKNKEILNEKNKKYREINRESILIQRKEYRNREDIKEKIKQNNINYLPIRKQKIKEKRKIDINFKMKEVLRSKMQKFLQNRKTSYLILIGCNLDFFKNWISYRFNENMNWNNFGEIWEIDHILPINSFNMNNEIERKICFHWTNLQPLNKKENRNKSDKFELHYYFNNIVSIFRFCKNKKEYLDYQIVNESLQWLRNKLRNGKNIPYEDVITSEIDNQQPRP